MEFWLYVQIAIIYDAVKIKTATRTKGSENWTSERNGLRLQENNIIINNLIEHMSYEKNNQIEFQELINNRWIELHQVRTRNAFRSWLEWGSHLTFNENHIFQKQSTSSISVTKFLNCVWGGNPVSVNIKYDSKISYSYSVDNPSYGHIIYLENSSKQEVKWYPVDGIHNIFCMLF